MYLTRSPEAFLRGLSLFVSRRHLAPAQLRFRWFGSVTGIDGLADTVRSSGAEPYVDFMGSIPHDQAIQELIMSDMALILQAANDTIHIPGKLFEAMGAHTPVLSVSPACEHTELVDRTGCGLHVPHDPERIAIALEQFWDWRASGSAWPFHEEEIVRYRADAAIAKLAALFDTVAGTSP